MLLKENKQTQITEKYGTMKAMQGDRQKTASLTLKMSSPIFTNVPEGP